jgi:lipopolysaccharide export system permease protein
MRILDRYIFKSVLSIFLSCLISFLFLYIIIDLFSHLDTILKQKTTLETLVQYYLTYLPIIFVQVAPISCLLATLYTFSKLNRENEIIAMRSSGMSIFQISKTVIIFGIVVSVFVFWINDRFVPYSSQLNQKVRDQLETDAQRQKNKGQETINNLSLYGLKNRLFFVNKFYLADNTLVGIVVLEHDEKQNVIKKIVAKKGVYNKELWRFYQCITYEFDENGRMKAEPTYSDEEIMPFTDTPQEFLNQRQSPELMTISELDNYIWKLSKSGANTVIRNLKVDLYQRFTFPLTSLIMIMLGIPFSLKIKKRAAGLSSFGLLLAIGFLYYVLNAVSIALGKAGLLPPLLSASLSHILAFLFSIYMLKRIY